jgi:hypothetical protein
MVRVGVVTCGGWIGATNAGGEAARVSELWDAPEPRLARMLSSGAPREIDEPRGECRGGGLPLCMRTMRTVPVAAVAATVARDNVCCLGQCQRHDRHARGSVPMRGTADGRPRGNRPAKSGRLCFRRSSLHRDACRRCRSRQIGPLPVVCVYLGFDGYSLSLSMMRAARVQFRRRAAVLFTCIALAWAAVSVRLDFAPCIAAAAAMIARSDRMP